MRAMSSARAGWTERWNCSSRPRSRPARWRAGCCPRSGDGVFQHSTPSEFTGLWLFLGVASGVVFLVNARDFFQQHFRAMALRPFGAKPPRVESKWSPMNWEAEPDGQANVP